jgi:hypothetical protein
LIIPHADHTPLRPWSIATADDSGAAEAPPPFHFADGKYDCHNETPSRPPAPPLPPLTLPPLQRASDYFEAFPSCLRTAGGSHNRGHKSARGPRDDGPTDRYLQGEQCRSRVASSSPRPTLSAPSGARSDPSRVRAALYDALGSAERPETDEEGEEGENEARQFGRFGWQGSMQGSLSGGGGGGGGVAPAAVVPAPAAAGGLPRSDQHRPTLLPFTKQHGSACGAFLRELVHSAHESDRQQPHSARASQKISAWCPRWHALVTESDELEEKKRSMGAIKYGIGKDASTGTAALALVFRPVLWDELMQKARLA